MATESSWVERFYTHFLGRDLAYLFAGGLFICVVRYALSGKITLSQGLSLLELVGLLMASYFIGLALSEFSGHIRLVPKELSLPDGYSNDLLLHQDLVTHYDASVLNRHERTIFLKHVGASVGVSSFWGAVLLVILAVGRYFLKNECPSSAYLGIVACLTVYGIYMIFHSRWKASQIEGERTALAAGVISKEQDKNKV